MQRGILVRSPLPLPLHHVRLPLSSFLLLDFVLHVCDDYIISAFIILIILKYKHHLIFCLQHAVVYIDGCSELVNIVSSILKFFGYGKGCDQNSDGALEWLLYLHEVNKKLFYWSMKNKGLCLYMLHIWPRSPYESTMECYATPWPLLRDSIS